jgi:hypothetical protein
VNVEHCFRVVFRVQQARLRAPLRSIRRRCQSELSLLLCSFLLLVVRQTHEDTDPVCNILTCVFVTTVNRTNELTVLYYKGQRVI